METCRWCGAPISSEETVCPECGVRLRRESTRCPRCKEYIRADLAVCPHCGEELGKRRIPWKLISALGGIGLAAIVIYAVVSFVPLPINVPLVAAIPSPTATEALLPPTATSTATPRPPTETPTATATFTPVITATATITEVATVTPAEGESPAPAETATATPTETPAFRYPAPRLLAPVDGEAFSGSGERIELRWEPVGALAKDEYYSVRLSYVNKKGETVDGVVAWVRNEAIPWRVEETYYGDLSLQERGVGWQIRVVWDPDGDGLGEPISPPSDRWSFTWR